MTALWLYFRFLLSLSMVEDMLAARGVNVSHQTVRLWAEKFGRHFASGHRASAVALIPLTLWFVASIIAHTNSDCADLVAWLKSPLASTPMILLLGASFYHAALGLQVVIDDYVHSGAKYVAVIAVRLVCFALASARAMVVLSIAFGNDVGCDTYPLNRSPPHALFCLERFLTRRHVMFVETDVSQRFSGVAIIP